MAAPLLPILVVTVVDIRAPPDVHLGPFLADAPAITASFGSPRITAFLGVMAVPAQVVVVAVRTSLTDLNHSLQITALILISAFVTFIAYGRERNERELTQLKSVAKAAPGVAKGATPLTGKGGSAQARPASERVRARRERGTRSCGRPRCSQRGRVEQLSSPWGTC
ncbi:hypothetical protein [Streptomyces chattanoogensis]|uniref:hypothetical protein n=1 Tax=Streptomyces chattanoogensis TaxID=66876 RepID=UPI0036940A39